MLKIPGWQAVIGIEAHVKLATRQKLFSNTLTALPWHPPNSHVNAYDAAFPGTLPKLNENAVTLAIRTALALKCKIAHKSSFDRKHYFYHDLPVGYQITQHYAPIAVNGELPLSIRTVEDPVRIKQIQIEQDTAKSTTLDEILSGSPKTQIDLNRAGQGLLEIVSHPDIRSPEEAALYVRTLQSVLRTIGASDGNMEMGSLRVDVNISLNPSTGERGTGTRCEIKNLNSVKSVVGALEFEISRQHALLTSTPQGKVEQETMTYDPVTFQTIRLRSKEDAPDYRYMPDPNLGSLLLEPNRIGEIASTMPQLPWMTRSRLRESYGLGDRDVDVLMDLDNEFSGNVYENAKAVPTISPIVFFERTCSGEGRADGLQRDPKLVINWMVNNLLGGLSDQAKTFSDNPLSVPQLGSILDMLQGREITSTSAKHLLKRLLSLSDPSPVNPRTLAQELEFLIGYKAPSGMDGDGSDLQLSCRKAIESMPSEAAALRSGKSPNVVHKIVGRVMKETKGRADPKDVARIILQIIDG